MTNNTIKKSVIFTDYNCNNNCIFCIDKNKRKIKGKNTEDIIREIRQAKARGTTYLEFIGGEVTIRKDIFDLIGYAKKTGFATIALVTNGRMFAYSNFAKRIADSGIDHLIFSIHGHNRELHDTLTASVGSFDQLSTGLRNLEVLGFGNIGSNTTIVKQNYKYLPEIGKFLLKKKIRNSEFIFVDPNYGAAKDDFDSLVPDISDMAPYVHRCLDLATEKENVTHWHIRYVPLCYFTDYLDQVSELEEVKKFRTEHLAPDFKNMDVEGSRPIVGRVKTEKCIGCRLYGQCEGIWAEYIKKKGDAELKPIMN